MTVSTYPCRSRAGWSRGFGSYAIHLRNGLRLQAQMRRATGNPVSSYHFLEPLPAWEQQRLVMHRVIFNRCSRSGYGDQIFGVMLMRFVASLIFAATSVASYAGDDIYLSYQKSSKQLPVYTDRPLNPASQVIGSVDAGSGHRTFVFVPAIVSPTSRRLSSRAAPRQAEEPLATRRDAVEPYIQQAAHKHGVDAALVKAVIEVESGFQSSVRSPKGATGLMQIMPATAARYGRFNLLSPEQNIDVGTRHLRDLLTLFNGNVRLAIAAYNAGERAVIGHGYQVPAYPETLKYVPMVLARYQRYLLPA